MLKPLKTPNLLISNSSSMNSPTGQQNQQGDLINKDEIAIFKLLIDNTNDMSKLKQFIFYVGTSCDNRHLRSKLKRLQEKLFQNITKQKEYLAIFFRNMLTFSSNNKLNNNKFKESELLRFTLTSLSYFESLIQRLIHLVDAYPLEENRKIELVVNLGFEDSAVEDNEEVIVKNETKEPDNQNFVLNENTEQFHLKKRDFNILDEKDEFKQGLEMIKKLIEDIELLDVNLLRFNIKSNDSNDFYKGLKEMNKSNSRHRVRNSNASKDSSDDEALTATGAIQQNATNNAKTKNSFKNIKNSTIKELCNRRKIVYSLLVFGLFLCIIAVILGLVFGLK